MLSTLSRGYSSWTGELDIGAGSHNAVAKKVVEVGPGEHQKHGVTITPRKQSGRMSARAHSASAVYPTTAFTSRSTACLDLPKTYLTRKGALLLFTAPEDAPENPQQPRRLPKKRKQQELIDLSLKLGTLERLTLSVLQYGDTNYDRENCSVTDKENRWALKFLHDLDRSKSDVAQPMIDHHAQPGEDLRFYLNDLKRRASTRAYGQERCLSSRARSQELKEILQHLEDAFPWTYSQPPQPPASCSGTSQANQDDFFYPYSPSVSSASPRTLSAGRVLSSRKLTASLKSVNYLGRPSSTDVETDNISYPESATGLQKKQPMGGRRIKSAYWAGLSGSTEQHTRPKSSHFAGRGQPAGSRRLIPSPDLDGSQQRDLSVPVIEEETGSPIAETEEEECHISVHLDSDVGYAGASDHLAASVVKDRDAEYDRVSIATSALEEEDIIFPSDEEVEEAESKTEAAEVTEVGDLSAAKPLQPQYAGVLQDDAEITHVGDGRDQDVAHRSEQGSLPGSRGGSADGFRASQVKCPSSAPPSAPVSRMGSHADGGAEEKDLAVYEAMLDVLAAEGSETTKIIEYNCTVQEPDPGSQLEGDSSIVGHAGQQEDKHRMFASSVSESVDRPEVEPETLVSMHVDGTQSKTLLLDDTCDESVPRPESPQATLVKAYENGSDLQEKLNRGRGDHPVTMNDEEWKSPRQESSTKDTAIQSSDQKTDLSTTVDIKIPPALPSTPKQQNNKTAPQQQEDVTDLGTSIPVVPVASRIQTTAQLKPSISLPSAQNSVTQKSKKGEADTAPGGSSPSFIKQAVHPRGDKPESKSAQQKSSVKFVDMTSTQPNSAGKKDQIPKEKEAPKPKKESYRPPPPPPKIKLPKEKDELWLPDHMKAGLMRHESQSQAQLENDLLRMKKAIDESLGTSVVAGKDKEGLTEEELQQAQQLLKERVEEAQRRMLEAAKPGARREKKAAPKEAEDAMKKGKKAKLDMKKTEEMVAQREEQKELQRQEMLRRLAAAQALQDLIAEKEAERRKIEEEAEQRARDMQEQIQQLREEEEAIQQAEDDARQQLADLRKIQREEREARRKQELEKKKDEASARRQKEMAMIEKAKKKEQEMLEQIADAEMRRALREEEQRKRDEEERLAQERYEEELLRAQLEAEEEEKRLRELERQAEEEAFRSIIAERETAERRKEELELLARRMAEEEESIRQQMMDEEKKLAEEKQRSEAEEEKAREEAKQRLRELEALEEEQREKMRVLLEQEREFLLKRREINLERMANLNGLRQTQSISPPWVFSYFLQWPRDSYLRPMGIPAGGAAKKPGKKKKKK